MAGNGELAGNSEFVSIVQYYFIFFSLMRGPVIEGYHSPCLFPDSGCRASPPRASATLTSFPWGRAGLLLGALCPGALCPACLHGQEAAGEGFSDLLTASWLLLRSESAPMKSRFLVFSSPSELSPHFS